MTIQLTDGFDMYNGIITNTGLQAKWTQFTVAGTPHSLVTGRFAGQAVQLQRTGTGTGGTIARNFPANVASFAMGAAMRWITLTSIAAIMPDISFYDGTPTIQCGLKVTGTGAVEVYRYTSETAGTLLGTTAGGIISTNVWHFIECEVTINDTTGVFKVYVDGTQVLNLTAQDTKNTANAYASNVRFGSGAQSGWSLAMNVDDFYMVDVATKLGECRVETLRPDADSGAQAWTPNSGANNFSRVNETLVDGDTTYVSASTVGNRDLYTLGDLSSTPATIHAVVPISFALKTDATSRSIYNSIQSNGTDSDGTAIALAASYTRNDRIIELDPSGGGAWTATRVNGLLIGPKVAV